MSPSRKHARRFIKQVVRRDWRGDIFAIIATIVIAVLVAPVAASIFANILAQSGSASHGHTIAACVVRTPDGWQGMSWLEIQRRYDDDPQAEVYEVRATYQDIGWVPFPGYGVNVRTLSVSEASIRFTGSGWKGRLLSGVDASRRQEAMRWRSSTLRSADTQRTVAFARHGFSFALVAESFAMYLLAALHVVVLTTSCVVLVHGLRLSNRETRRNAELLRRAKSIHDNECPHCGYSMDQLNTDRCPECGRTAKEESR